MRLETFERRCKWMPNGDDRMVMHWNGEYERYETGFHCKWASGDMHSDGVPKRNTDTNDGGRTRLTNDDGSQNGKEGGRGEHQPGVSASCLYLV